jgi:hypothetical protein
MYFQLNNIPMFRGAYLIYKVNHSIKPHSMTTTIKGNRVKKSKTPLIDKATMYMNLVGGNTNGGGTATIRSGSAAGDPNSKPESKFIDTNLQFYWLTNDGEIPTGKDTLGITNKTKKSETGLKNVAQGNSYAVREVVEVLQKMGFKFHKTNKDKPNAPDTIFYNDLSRLWGGKLEPHKSHQKGLTMDIYQSKDSKAGYSQVRQTPKAGGYNREYTLQWLTYLLDTPYRKYTIPNDYKETVKYINLKGETKTAKAGDTVKDQRSVKNIFFNDSGLQDIINDKYGKNLMTSLSNHDSHLHIEFLSPVRVVVESELGQNTRPATQANPDDAGNKIVNSQSAPSTDKETEDFMKALLKKLGAPETEGNLIFLAAWSQMEGGGATWNPFNTTQSKPGSTNFNDVGVKNYKTAKDGIESTYTTMTNGNYPNVLSGLRGGLKDKQEAYNLSVKLQKKPSGDFCVWVKGPTGCKNSANGLPLNEYVALCLSGRVRGRKIPKPKI